MKVLTVIGARPQFIKAAAVSAAIRERGGDIHEVIVHTGQHFDHNMSRIFFVQMGIPEPAYSLDIHNLPHGAMTGAMLTRLEVLMQAERPDMVMVYGDTNSTLAGALAARKLNIPVAHVEAGLRSYDMTMPEEINRILTDRISTLLFCPTAVALENLRKEGFRNFSCEMVLTGDVMLDAVMRFRPLAEKPDAALPGRYALATIHRQSNTDHPENLRNILRALQTIARDIPVVLPLHPRTQAVMKREGITLNNSGIVVIDPVGYLESLWLIDNAGMVFTDSGGLQKEAYFFAKTCVTLRNETEWTELVDTGTNIPAGVTMEGILQAYTTLRERNFVPDPTLYGGGKASGIIVEHLFNRHRKDESN